MDKYDVEFRVCDLSKENPTIEPEEGDYRVVRKWTILRDEHWFIQRYVKGWFGKLKWKNIDVNFWSLPSKASAINEAVWRMVDEFYDKDK